MPPTKSLNSPSEPLLAPRALLEKIEAARLAIRHWRLAHAELVSALQSVRLDGWLASGEPLLPAPESLLRSLDTLEYAGDRPLQAVGFIHVPRELAPLVLAAADARKALNDTTMPLRKLKRQDLERLPEGTELGGQNLQEWLRLMPSSPIWKAVADTLGVPRIYLAQATRHLITDGLMLDDLPEGVGFCWTAQRVIRATTQESVRKTLEEMSRENSANPLATIRDLQRLDAIGQQYGRVDMAYIYGSQQVPSVNLSWADGRKTRKLAPLPVFWAGDQVPFVPPLTAEPPESRRRPRKDRKYGLHSVLESLNVYAEAKVKIGPRLERDSGEG